RRSRPELTRSAWSTLRGSRHHLARRRRQSPEQVLKPESQPIDMVQARHSGLFEPFCRHGAEHFWMPQMITVVQQVLQAGVIVFMVASLIFMVMQSEHILGGILSLSA